MRRLVAIHVLPAMRLVLPAFVCSVGSRVVAMDASLFGNRCSFMAFLMFCLPSGYPCGLAAAVATLLITAGQPQETRPASGGVLVAGALPVGQCQSWESSGPRTIGVTYLRRGDARNEKAPRGEPGGAWNQLLSQAANPAQAG